MTKEAAWSGPKGALTGGVGGGLLGTSIAAAILRPESKDQWIKTLLMGGLRGGASGALYGGLLGSVANPKTQQKARDRQEELLRDIETLKSRGGPTPKEQKIVELEQEAKAILKRLANK